MKYQILSRNKAKRLSFHLTEPTIIISITDVDKPPVLFQRSANLLNVLRLSFNDVDKDGDFPMQPSMAREVIRFVSRYLDKVKRIVVHCEAGISRSAGVCAALMVILEGTDSAVFENPKYHPNPCCYSRVLNAYYGGYDRHEPAVESESRVNIIKYKAEQPEGFQLL